MRSLESKGRTRVRSVLIGAPWPPLGNGDGCASPATCQGSGPARLLNSLPNERIDLDLPEGRGCCSSPASGPRPTSTA